MIANSEVLPIVFKTVAVKDDGRFSQLGLVSMVYGELREPPPPHTLLHQDLCWSCD